jgi:hypothetical protein
VTVVVAQGRTQQAMPAPAAGSRPADYLYGGGAGSCGMLLVRNTRPLLRQLLKSRLVYSRIESDSQSSPSRCFCPVPYHLRACRAVKHTQGRVLLVVFRSCARSSRCTLSGRVRAVASEQFLPATG